MPFSSPATAGDDDSAAAAGAPIPTAAAAPPTTTSSLSAPSALSHSKPTPPLPERPLITQYDTGSIPFDNPSESKAIALVDITVTHLLYEADRDHNFSSLIKLCNRSGRILYNAQRSSDQSPLPLPPGAALVDVPHYCITPPLSWTVTARSIRVRLARYVARWLCQDGYTAKPIKAALQASVGESNLQLHLFRTALGCLCLESWPKWTAQAVQASGSSVAAVLTNACETLMFLLNRDEVAAPSEAAATWPRLAGGAPLNDLVDGLVYLLVLASEHAPQQNLWASEKERAALANAGGALLHVLVHPDSPTSRPSVARVVASKYVRTLFDRTLRLAEDQLAAPAWPHGLLACLGRDSAFAAFLEQLASERPMGNLAGRFLVARKDLPRSWPVPVPQSSKAVLTNGGKRARLGPETALSPATNRSLENFCNEDSALCMASRALLRLQWRQGYPDAPFGGGGGTTRGRTKIFCQGGPVLVDRAADLLAVRGLDEDEEAMRRERCAANRHNLNDDSPMYRLCNPQVAAVIAASAARSAFIAQLVCYKTSSPRATNAVAAARSAANLVCVSIKAPVCASSVLPPLPLAARGDERMTSAVAQFCGKMKLGRGPSSQFAHVAIAKIIQSAEKKAGSRF